MKVTVISMPVYHKVDKPGMAIIPPTAIYLLGEILRINGHEVDIIDPFYIRKLNPVEDENCEKLIDFFKKRLKNTDLVSISSNTFNWSMTVIAIKVIKKIYPNKKIVVGGLHPTYFYKYVLASTKADFVLAGDGEKSLLKLVNTIETNGEYANVLGLVWKEGGQIVKNGEAERLDREEIKELPYPNFSYVPKDVYGIIPIETSRGCRYGCRFCSIPHKHNWVGYDADWAAERVLKIVHKYKKNFLHPYVYIVDDCFTVDNDRAIKILQHIFENNKDIRLTIEARASDLKNEKLIELLSYPQITRVAIGVECGYNEGLKAINKGLTIELLEEKIKLFEKYDLMKKVYFSFIIGFPWETVDNYIQTIDYAASIVERFRYKNVNLNWLKIFPSQIWEERMKYGIDLDESVYDNHNFSTDLYIFKRTHPRVNRYARDFIFDYLKQYEERGICLFNG
ncbi:Radical SAM domain protein [Clostridium sp. DL-VIII]|uniref:B12-binding domain-containing radical SAM protein n=1 Tax=Clostridium sp. DL-VIII TaxID=641107 RepID=UPI00023B02F1|nr:radical SAM protein [Clostridium sp. DL-VIII]EHJ01791.1 Radical SAM domain protein [Clostridium sp. DL-VIII]